MRDFRTYVNSPAGNDPASNNFLGATNIVNFLSELKAVVARAGLTLSTDDGTADSNTTQMAESAFIYGVKSQSFQAGGTVDAITLTPVSGSSGVFIPSSYDNIEGAVLNFEPTGANTGAVTVSIGQTSGTQLSTKKLLASDGTALSGGEIGTDRIEIYYDPTADSSNGAWLLAPWSSIVVDTGLSADETADPVNRPVISNNSTDSDHDIDITAGSRVASDRSKVLVLNSGLTKKIDVSWAAGDGSGGLASALTLSSDTWYHVFLIEVSGSVDVGFDTDVDASNLVADEGATYYRRIGSVLTDGSANILAFIQIGNEVLFETPILDINDTSAGSTATTAAISTPLGVKCKANLNVQCRGTGGAITRYAYVSSLDTVDLAPSATASPVSSAGSSVGGASGVIDHTQISVFTNASSQIRYRLDNTGTFLAATLGWTDLDI